MILNTRRKGVHEKENGTTENSFGRNKLGIYSETNVIKVWSQNSNSTSIVTI